MHIVVEQAPAVPDGVDVDRPFWVYPLSARTDGALDELAGRHAESLTGSNVPSFPEAVATVATGRAHLEHRIAVVAADAPDAASLLRAAADEPSVDVVRGHPAATDGEVVMLFTGQGSQAPGMGRLLYDTEPAFKQSLDDSATILRELSGIDLLDVMFDPGHRAASESIHDTRHAQPALLAYEVAMADLWRSWGVVPAAVLGHSIGELAAACVAGVMSRQDAMRVVEARGRLMSDLPRDGGMVALLTDAGSAAEAIAPWPDTLSIAAINGPRSVVVSGRLDAVDAVVASAEEQGIKAVRLEVSHAFHSPSMDPMLDAFEAVVSSVDLNDPDIELISNRTAASATPGLLTAPSYWRNHVRQAVRFAESVQTTIELGYRMFLEVGPTATLTAMVTACGVPADVKVLASARANGDETRDVQRALAGLHTAGLPIDWPAYTRGVSRRPDGVPGYPFERQRYWHPAVDADRRALAGGPINATDVPLHGQLLRSPRLADQVYGRELGPSAPDWLADHVVYGATIVPATAYLEMMRRAGSATTGGAVDVTDVRIEGPLVLTVGVSATVQTIIAADGDGLAVEVYSDHGEGWHRHAIGRLADLSPALPTTENLDDAWARCPHVIEGADYYKALTSLGVDYGPTFRGIERAGRRDGEAVAVLHAVEPDGPRPSVHPALADACLQVLGLAMPGGDDLTSADGDVYLPVGVERWHVAGDASGVVTAHGRLRRAAGSATDDVVVGDVDLYDTNGVLVAGCAGVRFKRAPRTAIAAATRVDSDWLYMPRWSSVPLAGTAVDTLSGHWLVASEGAFGELLVDRLQAIGATAEVVGLPEVVSRDVASLAGVVVVADAKMSGPALASSVADVATHLASTADDVPLTVATVGAAAVVPADGVVGYQQAALQGLVGVANSEHSQHRCRLVDVAVEGADACSHIVAELLADERDEPLVAWRDGVRYALRLDRPSDIDDVTELDLPSGPYELRIDERGRLDALYVAEQDVLAPDPGEVLIDVRATGLNFRDVLNALGTYAGDATSLGNECAGTVVAVGEGVTRVRVGDRVMAVAVASFATRCVVPESMVTHQPAGWTDAEAATVPIAFLTADFALNHLGRMRAGERVLIHAAAGGVGLAAVQLAQRVGAEIFATAGSDAKRAALRALGVEHVYDSRRTDFAEQIMGDTGGAGVDLVLNSLSGDSIDASVGVLTDAGRFLEIGLAGIWSDEQFHGVRPDAEYHVIFLGQACVEQPELIAARFDAVAAACSTGELHALPLVAFDVRHAVTAFRYMAQARQIGKVVVTANIGWNVADAGGTWIVTGGLGGLGLEVAAELAEGGAERLVLCSRRQPDESGRSAVEALRRSCPDVRVVALDVADADAVAAMVGDVTADGVPLRGVVHAAGVLDDALLRDLTPERFETVWRPKVLGAENLADAVDPHHPDHFVLFSAGAVLFGAAGQGNYAAANAAIDALAHRRGAAGLPAQTIDWGPWTTVGMASRLGEDALRRWEAQGVVGIDPGEGRRAFRAVIAGGDTQVAVLKLRWPALLHHFSKHGVPPILRDVARSEQRRAVGSTSSTSIAGDLATELNDLEPERRGERLRERVRSEVLRVLGLDQTHPIAANQGLTDVGMDSLMAVELSNRLAVMIDRTLPSTLAFEQPTVDDLAAHLRLLLEDRVEFDGAGVTAAGDDELADLSTDELTDELLRELDDAGY